MYLEFFFSWAYLKKRISVKKKKKEVNMEIYNSIFYHIKALCLMIAFFMSIWSRTIDEQNHI